MAMSHIYSDFSLPTLSYPLPTLVDTPSSLQVISDVLVFLFCFMGPLGLICTICMTMSMELDNGTCWVHQWVHIWR